MPTAAAAPFLLPKEFVAALAVVDRRGDLGSLGDVVVLRD